MSNKMHEYFRDVVLDNLLGVPLYCAFWCLGLPLPPPIFHCVGKQFNWVIQDLSMVDPLSKKWRSCRERSA